MNMYKILMNKVLLVALCIAASSTWADKYQNTLEMFKKSPEVQRFFNNSYGYAVFPVVGKGGFGLGGAHGKGRVYRSGTAVGKASLNQLTLGFQIGGQAFSQIIFFEDKSAFKEFTNGSFEFGAQATAVAITVGAQAQAGTTGTSTGASVNTDAPGAQKAKYYKGMVTFVHVKGGLMYEASIGGQKFVYKSFSHKGKSTEPSPSKQAEAVEVRDAKTEGVATYAVDPIEPVTEINEASGN